MQEQPSTNPDQETIHTNPYYAPGSGVFSSDGKKLGKVSARQEPGALVVARGMFAAEKEVNIPLEAIAGADKDGIFLLYQEEELLGRHKGTPLNSQPTSLGDAVAREVRPPKEQIAQNVQKIGEKATGDDTGHAPG